MNKLLMLSIILSMINSGSLIVFFIYYKMRLKRIRKKKRGLLG